MNRFKSKKGIALLVTLVVVAASAFGAYAYFTASGTGTGSAKVGTSANTITVIATETDALTPGGPSGIVTFTASNGSNFNQQLSNIHLVSIASDKPLCSTVVGGGNPDFTMADVAVGTD